MGKKDSIVLHPKYGLNPTIAVCVVCKEETGEIALLGRSYKDEAPREMVISFEPCSKCREKYLQKGVLLLEVPEDGVITGRLYIISNKLFEAAFTVDIPKAKICFLDKESFEKIKGLCGDAKIEK